MTEKEKKSKILLLDDHKLFREGAARLLQSESDLEIVGMCGSVDEALEILQSTPIDIVLFDLDLRRERCDNFFNRARGAGYSGRAMLVAANVNTHQAKSMLRSGVTGLFLKDDDPGLLIDAIRIVLEGGEFVCPSIAALLDDELESGNSRELSARDHAVWDAVVEGLTNKEIAARLYISEALVKATLQQLFDKYDVRSRSQLVRIALEQRSLR